MRPNSTPRHRNRRLLVGLLALVVLLTAACFGGAEDAGEPASFDDGVTDGQGAQESPTGGSDGDAATDTTGGVGRSDAEPGSNGVTGVRVVQTQGRDIIFTADLTVAVTDVGAATNDAVRVVEGLGGFLFGQETIGQPEPRSILTFKILPEDFQEAVSRLAGIGELRTQTVTADDVTERVVDLQSRINTADASVERLRGFLEQATDVTTIAQLENQLLERETELETLRGQLRTIQDRIDLATIVLRLTEAAANPQVELFTTAYPGHEDAGLSCPGERSITVDEDSPVTLCFELTNAGDTALTDFEVSDPVIGLELDDLLVVLGDPGNVIEPGQSIILAAEIDVARNVRTQTRVTAVPVDEEGTPLPGRTAADTDTMFLDSVDPGGVPGFSDGLSASWDVLVTLGGIIVLIAGVVVPFLWVALLVLLAAWWLRRRNGDPNGTPVDDDPSEGRDRPVPEQAAESSVASTATADDPPATSG